jgi:hypothetical protein
MNANHTDTNRIHPDGGQYPEATLRLPTRLGRLLLSAEWRVGKLRRHTASPGPAISVRAFRC